MKRNKMLAAACWLPLVLAGCATTTFTSTWKAPDAKPLQFKAGEKVIALVVAKQESIRRSGETNLAGVLDRAGLKGVPAYTLAIEGEATDESKAKQLYDASGAVGVVVLRPLRQEKEISSTTYGSPYYGGFWGGGYGRGYYGYGWGGAWGAEPRSAPIPTSSSRR